MGYVLNLEEIVCVFVVRNGNNLHRHKKDLLFQKKFSYGESLDS